MLAFTAHQIISSCQEHEITNSIDDIISMLTPQQGWQMLTIGSADWDFEFKHETVKPPGKDRIGIRTPTV